ncbi:hypothetical protein GCM10029963_69600 [Micromonospora andamanensis]
MADPSTYRPAPGTIPEAPGVYRFYDGTGRVIYVGKAKNLRSRLNSYFADLWGLHQRTQQMVTTAESVDWVTVGTEVEALQLEYLWIKQYDPRFNVRYRDDKSYPYLAVTLDEEYPRLQVMRGAKRKGVRYFGPYSHAWAIRETLDLLLRVFPARTCSAGVFKRAGQVGRPCLLGYIGKCSAPCVGSVSAERHREIVDDFCDFMAGRTDTMVRKLEREMAEASEQLEFERAARLRDDVAALRRAMEKQTVVLGDGTDADVVAFADDPLEAAVQVFHVRGGRVRGQRGWVVEKTEELTTGDLVHHFCTQVYGGEHGEADVPRELLVPELPADAEALADWLSTHRGGRVTLRVPQRGDKRALMETVERNAKDALARHKLRRAGDLTTRSKALDEITEALGLRTAPLRIECFDISQIQGTDVVASMVVFEDGLPRKSEYRRFIIRGPPTTSRRCPRCCAVASPATSTPAPRPVRWVSNPPPTSPSRPPPWTAPPETPLPLTPLPVSRPRSPPPTSAARRSPSTVVTQASPTAATSRGSERWSTRRPAGHAGSRTRRSWWWSTAARRRSPPPRRPSPSWASTTWRCAAWPSGWRRSGCPTTTSRSSCRALPRGSTCCNGSATRRTASPSPSTGSAAPSG